MPFNLVAVPAALIPEGQNVLIGDITVLAGTRVAMIGDGTSQGSVLASQPPGTLFGNLSEVVATGKSWDMATFAGLGLSYLPATAGGNFAKPKGASGQAFPTAATSQTYIYPVDMVINDVLLIAIATGALTTITPPATWTLVGSQSTSTSTLAVYKRVITGFENDTETVVFGTASGAIVHDWLLDKAHGDMEVTVALNDSPAGTSLDIGAVTPSWAVIEAANTYYIAVIGLDIEAASTVSGFPAGYTLTGQDAIANATASINCRIAFAEKATLGQTENPGAFTYGAARAAGIIIAIRPATAGRLNWDGVGVRKNTAGSTFTRRRLNLIEGAGISLTVADDPTDEEVDITITNIGAGGTPGWPAVLAVDAHSGANNPIVDDSQFLQFGTALGVGVLTGQARTSNNFLFNCDASWRVLASEAINLDSSDSSSWQVDNGGLTLESFDGLSIESLDSFVSIDALTTITMTAPVVALATGFLRFIEAAASTPAMAAGQGLFWVKNNAPNDPFFTDDTNADRQIATYPLLFSGFPSIADDTFLGNVSGGVAVPSAVTISTLAGAGLVFGTHTLNVTAGAGASLVVGANDIQRGALTGAITAAQDSGATAFGALAAKSVLANATNASAVPAALAGSAAFQHLRVNSANTALEWSVFTTGDFPSASVPITAIATIGTDTFLANVTAGTASPTAVNISTLAGAGLVFGAHTLDVTAGAGGSIVVAANDVQRGALTGAITAAQDSNTTAFGVLAAKSVLANATNASAVPAALAGSAAFQHLRVNSANTALEWSVFTAGDFPAGVVPLTGVATQAAHTFVANATAGVASPTAITATAATAELDVFTSALKGLVPLSGGGTVNFLRADGTFAAPTTGAGTGLQFVTFGAEATLSNERVTTASATIAIDVSVASQIAFTLGAHTGAITSSANSLVTAFGALAAKSVLANATNASAVPAALAGSAAFQHLRVNSANTALEWSVFTAGDFPAGIVPLASIATQAANTFLANATAGVASPTAVASNAEGVMGRTSGNIQSIDSAVQSALIRGSGSVFWGAAAADQVLRRSGSGDLGFGSLVTNNIGANQVTNARLAQMAAKTVKVNATNVLADPTDLAGTAAFQHLRVNSANTGLEWSIFTAGDFPADIIPLGSIATVAANTVLANATAGVANATAVTIGTNTVLGRVGANIVAAQLVNAQVTTNTLAYTKLAQTASGRKLLGTFSDGASDLTELDQLTVTQLMALPSTAASHGILWEDEDFHKGVVASFGTTNVTVGNTLDVFSGATGNTSQWFVHSTDGTTVVGALGSGTSGHKGILSVSTGAVLGNSCELFLARDGSSPLASEAVFDADDLLSMDWYMMLPEVTAKRVTVGMGTDIASATAVFGTESACFYFDTAIGTNWRAIVRTASVSNADVDTGFTAVANDWVKFTIRRVSSSAWDFYINNSLFLSSGAAGPTAGVVPGLVMRTTAAAAKSVRVDRCRIFLNDRALFN